MFWPRWAFRAILLVSGYVVLAGILANKTPVYLNLGAEYFSENKEKYNLAGFNRPEEDAQGNKFIWISSTASFVIHRENRSPLNSPLKSPLKVALQARSAAVAGGPDAAINVLVNGQQVTQFQLDPANLMFQKVEFLVPGSSLSSPKIELYSSSFSPPDDPRKLGFMLQSLRVEEPREWFGFDKYWIGLLLLAGLSLFNLILMFIYILYKSRKVAYLVYPGLIAGVGLCFTLFSLFVVQAILQNKYYAFGIAGTLYITGLFSYFPLLYQRYFQVGKLNPEPFRP